SIDGVKAVKLSGVDVIVTDHHLPGEQLPEADAIVNPNQPGDKFESKNLAGVGVVFYLMAALRDYLRNNNWFEEKKLKQPNLADYLDLVALGTVADVVKLDHNNRILVAQGLARIRAGKACPGIRALLQVSGRNERRVVSSDLGFCLGPRLNAAGRLDDISIGIDCLLADDMQLALEKAEQLDRFNRERRNIETTMQEQALQHVEKILQNKSGELPSAVCLFDPEFHEGVIGILAGRVKETLHRPTIVFAKTDNGYIKGSARSIPGLHIRDALDRIATQYPEILSKFGGHAMAAGLTIQENAFERFVELFITTVDSLLDEDALQQTLHCDGMLTADDLNLQLAETLQSAGPWGQGFPEPQFTGRFELVRRKIVAESHLKLLLKAAEQYIDAIAFRTTDTDWPKQVSHIDIVYKLDVNDFNGQRNLQLIVDHIAPVV
ncbi:MAG: single-stranded-DNA-specific exonuclease RecJ, partial [Thioalkalispiraceae bacterium]